MGNPFTHHQKLHDQPHPLRNGFFFFFTSKRLFRNNDSLLLEGFLSERWLRTDWTAQFGAGWLSRWKMLAGSHVVGRSTAVPAFAFRPPGLKPIQRKLKLKVVLAHF